MDPCVLDSITLRREDEKIGASLGRLGRNRATKVDIRSSLRRTRLGLLYHLGFPSRFHCHPIRAILDVDDPSLVRRFGIGVPSHQGPFEDAKDEPKGTW